MTDARLLAPDDPAMSEVLSLIRSSFAFMDGIIDPPSSMHRLTLADLRTGPGEVWVIGRPVAACVVLTAKPATLYIGKLAVAESSRGQGLARRLINTAEARARSLGLSSLALQTRVELTDNHAAFRAMGFAKTGETAHPGFDLPTSYTFTKPL